MIGAKKLTWKTVFQSSAIVSMELSLAPPGFFGRDGGIVDERMKARALLLQALLHLEDGLGECGRISEIDLDVILRSRIPGTVLRKGMARAP